MPSRRETGHRSPKARRTTKKRMVTFCISSRLYGDAREDVRRLVFRVARKFRVRGAVKERPVPHVTLYYRSQTEDIGAVVSAVRQIGQKYTLIPFRINGFGHFNHDVVYLNINPSAQLKKLRWELAQELMKVSVPSEYDKQQDFVFHTTIAFLDINKKFKKIWEHIGQLRGPVYDRHLVRIAILNNRRKILYEYDLILKKLLTRREALGRYWWRKTMSKLRELQGVPLEEPQSFLDRLTMFIKSLSR